MKNLISILMLLSCCETMAEMRMWEDRKGNVLEAEFKCEVSGRVILHDAKGKEYKLPISGLSEKDQKYIQTKLPPKIEIKFKKSQDRKNDSYIIEMRGEVTLTKTSRLPYSRELKATLFVIGEDSGEDEYIVMDKKDFSFSFEKVKKHEFKGDKFKMHHYPWAGTNDGVEYRGYLVMICDEDGNIIALKGSSDEFEKNVEYLRKLKLGARFDDKMRDEPTRKSSTYRTYS